MASDSQWLPPAPNTAPALKAFGLVIQILTQVLQAHEGEMATAPICLRERDVLGNNLRSLMDKARGCQAELQKYTEFVRLADEQFRIPRKPDESRTELSEACDQKRKAVSASLTKLADDSEEKGLDGVRCWVLAAMHLAKLLGESLDAIDFADQARGYLESAEPIPTEPIPTDPPQT